MSRDWCRDRSRERVINAADEQGYAVPETLPQKVSSNSTSSRGVEAAREIKIGGEQDRAFNAWWSNRRLNRPDRRSVF